MIKNISLGIFCQKAYAAQHLRITIRGKPVFGPGRLVNFWQDRADRDRLTFNPDVL